MFLGIDWGRLVSADFWINVRPGGLSTKFEVIFLIILVMAYSLYGVSVWMQKKERFDAHKVYVLFWKKFSDFALTMAITFTFIFFFRYEGIPYLGSRIWFLLWVVALISWLAFLINYYYRVIPKVLEEQSMRAQKMKYFK